MDDYGWQVGRGMNSGKRGNGPLYSTLLSFVIVRFHSWIPCHLTLFPRALLLATVASPLRAGGPGRSIGAGSFPNASGGGTRPQLRDVQVWTEMGFRKQAIISC